MHIKVNMVPVSGLVNIAAEITIFAQRVYDEMSPHPENACSIYVNLAGGAATTWRPLLWVL